MATGYQYSRDNNIGPDTKTHAITVQGVGLLRFKIMCLNSSDLNLTTNLIFLNKFFILIFFFKIFTSNILLDFVI